MSPPAIIGEQINRRINHALRFGLYTLIKVSIGESLNDRNRSFSAMTGMGGKRTLATVLGISSLKDARLTFGAQIRPRRLNSPRSADALLPGTQQSLIF
jgi:hypothetical protein